MLNIQCDCIVCILHFWDAAGTIFLCMTVYRTHATSSGVDGVSSSKRWPWHQSTSLLLLVLEGYPLARYADVVEWVWKVHPSLSPDVALVAVSVRLPFPVPGGDDGFMFVLAAVAMSASREESLKGACAVRGVAIPQRGFGRPARSANDDR